eukprot:g753.t1
MSVNFQAGSGFINCATSYVSFDLTVTCTTDVPYNFGIGSASNLFRTNIVTTRSGAEVDRFQNANVLLPQLHRESTTAPATAAQGVAKTYVIPLSHFAGIFTSKQLMPSQLASVMVLLLNLPTKQERMVLNIHSLHLLMNPALLALKLLMFNFLVAVPTYERLQFQIGSTYFPNREILNNAQAYANLLQTLGQYSGHAYGDLTKADFDANGFAMKMEFGPSKRTVTKQENIQIGFSILQININNFKPIANQPKKKTMYVIRVDFMSNIHIILVGIVELK